MPEQDLESRPYRPCVGVVLVNGEGQIFAGQRADMTTPAWQMPQGGVDAGESPRDAALRELLEETGVGEDHVTVLGETANWLPYDFPPEVADRRWGGRFRGQKQKWVLMRLDAPDDVIDLAYKDEEFSHWRWMAARDLMAVIVEFKRPIYEQVLTEFRLL